MTAAFGLVAEQRTNYVYGEREWATIGLADVRESLERRLCCEVVCLIVYDSQKKRQEAMVM